MIETGRLLLRPFEPDDLEPYAVIRSRPSVARFLPGGEAGARQAADKARVTGTIWGPEAWSAGGFAPWAVIEKRTGQLIGHLGLRYLSEIRATELLYLLDEPWWGLGLATEGGHAAIAFARDQLGLARLVGFVLAENHRSVSVLRKLGFHRDGEQSIFGLETVRYVLDLEQG